VYRQRNPGAVDLNPFDLGLEVPILVAVALALAIAPVLIARWRRDQRRTGKTVEEVWERVEKK